LQAGAFGQLATPTHSVGESTPSSSNNISSDETPTDPHNNFWTGVALDFDEAVARRGGYGTSNQFPFSKTCSLSLAREAAT
jgi:hypothetical protein